MKQSVEGIVLQSVKHSDRTSIVTVYTAAHGRLALAVAAGPSGRRKGGKSPLMPLSVVEFSADLGRRGATGVIRPSGLTLGAVWRTLYFSPVKTALGLFLAEFLARLLREGEPDRGLYAFVRGSLQVLDTLERGVANFHLVFLTRLAYVMGIGPDTSGYTPRAIFDMRSGVYTPLHPGHYDVLEGSCAHAPQMLGRLDYANMHRLRLTRLERNRLLEGLLSYWNIHFPGTATLKSLEVLRDIFS